MLLASLTNPLEFLSNPIALLSLIVFLPAACAILLSFLPKEREDLIKLFAMTTTIAVFLLTVWIAIPASDATESTRFALGVGEMQNTFSIPWIPAFNIYYAMGIDGISFPLVILTSFLSVLAMAASWNIAKQIKGYCILFLILETGMLGVFLARDFFLFYVFWEVMLLPMYFLIGIWGGPRKEYAAIKFFLFTLVGGVTMLIAVLILYFHSDLRALDTDQIRTARVSAEELRSHMSKGEEPIHTFNMQALAEMGRLQNSPFDRELLWGKSAQWWAFVLLFIAFIIKLPAFPVHTWLPDAHVEAPTPISMILAGVLLKMGGYGIIRICYPICPDAAFDLAWMVCAFGVVSMVYGAFAAMAQTDFKRLVAYSSVSHMGYVLLGIGVWTATAGNEFQTEYWTMGISGAMFQMIAHGISSAGMFFLVGVIYDRVHHRDLNQYGGLFAKMPIYSGVSVVIFFAAMGLPGLCGFIGEILVVLASWRYSMVLAVIAASVVILTAGYILWTLQRVYLGPEYKGPHAEAISRITPRELSIAVPMVVLAIVLGVVPGQLLRYMNPSVEMTVGELAEWTRQVKQAPQRTQIAETPPASVPPAPQQRPPAGPSVSTDMAPSAQPSLGMALGYGPSPDYGRNERRDAIDARDLTAPPGGGASPPIPPDGNPNQPEQP